MEGKLLSSCWEGKTVHFGCLHIEPEQHDIALFHSVLLTLCTHLHTNRFTIVSMNFRCTELCRKKASRWIKRTHWICPNADICQ